MQVTNKSNELVARAALRNSEADGVLAWFVRQAWKGVEHNS